MEFNDEELARKYLGRVSYFRMKYFWIDMIDEVSGDFKEDVCFEDIIERYEFDKSLRQIIFNSIETLEVALRTKIISVLSLATDSGLWYLDNMLFENKEYHEDFVLDLKYDLVEAQILLLVIISETMTIGTRSLSMVTIQMRG